MSETFITTVAIGVNQLRIGDAKLDGRAPSHDGEYLIIYSVEDDWVGEDGGGSFGEDELLDAMSDPNDDESPALLNRIRETIKTPSETIPSGSELSVNFSSGVAEIMEIIGWIVPTPDEEAS